MQYRATTAVQFTRMNKEMFNPFNLLMTALGYGKSIWTKVNLLSSTEAIPLITLTIILEEHIQTLCSLCELDKSSHEVDNSLLSTLS
jgi:hypothetical protein